MRAATLPALFGSVFSPREECTRAIGASTKSCRVCGDRRSADRVDSVGIFVQLRPGR